MLAPHELKNKTFTKAVRGYNPAEVNEYIEFLIEKYTEIYRANNELERKLKVVATKLEEIKEDEESIRSTLLKAQKMGEQIISDASARADGITASIKDRCDVIIADFKDQAKTEKDELWKIRSFVLDFKKRLFDSYREHIQSLQSISVNDIEEIVLPDEDVLAEGILNDVNKAVRDEINNKTAQKTTVPKKEAPVTAETKKPSEAEKPKQAKIEKVVPDLSAFNKEEKPLDESNKKEEAKKDNKDASSKDEDPFIKALEQTASK